jgi:hypothetical protein
MDTLVQDLLDANRILEHTARLLAQEIDHTVREPDGPRQMVKALYFDYDQAQKRFAQLALSYLGR